jgi:hypothetical protein
MKKLVLFLILILCIGAQTAPAQNASADGVKWREATTYQIRNVKFGDLLRARDAKNANGTPIVLCPAQSWKCMT